VATMYFYSAVIGFVVDIGITSMAARAIKEGPEEALTSATRKMWSTTHGEIDLDIILGSARSYGMSDLEIKAMVEELSGKDGGFLLVKFTKTPSLISGYKKLNALGSPLKYNLAAIELVSNPTFLAKIELNPKLISFVEILTDEGRISVSNNIAEWAKLYDVRGTLKNGNVNEAVNVLGGALNPPKVYNGANYVEELTTGQVGKLNDIVNSTTDVAQVSNNLGININIVQEMKQHMFIREHLIEVGEGVFVKGRFAVSEYVTDLWNQVKAGDLSMGKGNELTSLISHEYIEAKVMQEGMIYRRSIRPISAFQYGAHDISSRDFFTDFSQWSIMNRKIPPFVLNPNLGNIDEIISQIKIIEGF
jgi:hypothetical protein